MQKHYSAMPCAHDSSKTQRASSWPCLCWWKSSNISGTPLGWHPSKQVKTGFTLDQKICFKLLYHHLGWDHPLFCWLLERIAGTGQLKSSNINWGATRSLVSYFMKSNVFLSLIRHRLRLKQTLRDLTTIGRTFQCGSWQSSCGQEFYQEPAYKLMATLNSYGADIWV